MSEERVLARSVTVFDPDSGTYTPYLKGDAVPEEHQKLITSPGVWEDEGEDGEPDELAGRIEELHRDYTVPELKELAEELDIDLGDAHKKDDIVDAIVKAENANNS